MPRLKSETTRERRTFPAGSVIVPLAQKLAKVAINLLEPQAPDSLVAWGFFNAIFEQYAAGADVASTSRDTATSAPFKTEQLKARATGPQR